MSFELFGPSLKSEFEKIGQTEIKTGRWNDEEETFVEGPLTDCYQMTVRKSFKKESEKSKIIRRIENFGILREDREKFEKDFETKLQVKLEQIEHLDTEALYAALDILG